MNRINQVWTIGHSNHPWERFLSLLRGAGATAVADVRSAPFSQFTPQFNREVLREALRQEGMAYVYLGAELGGRPHRTDLYRDGIADYEAMARESTFATGLARLLDGASRYRIAIMCSEQDPLDCHRCLLVGRRLVERGVAVHHILADGAIRTHAEIEEELLRMTRQAEDDLFASRSERLDRAYLILGRKAAFSEPRDLSKAAAGE